MNLGVLLIGLGAAVAVAVGLEAQAGSAHRRRLALQRDGVTRPGTITAVDATGKYQSHRRLTIAVDGSSFVETVPFLEAEQAGYVVGAAVAVRVLPNDPSTGRIDRGDAEPADPSHAGRWIGLFIVVLAVAAALVV